MRKKKQTKVFVFKFSRTSINNNHKKRPCRRRKTQSQQKKTLNKDVKKMHNILRLIIQSELLMFSRYSLGDYNRPMGPMNEII